MMGFRIWEAEVDKELVQLCGFGIDDLPDMPYRDWYNDEMEAYEAAKEVLRIMKEDAPW